MANTVKIIDFKKEGERKYKVELDEYRLNKILEPVQHIPIIVLSITGAFRTGKSFFMNLVATYLEHKSQVTVE